MSVNETLEEVREANLSYLMLAQQMLREDQEAAMFRLGIGKGLADMLQALTTSQVLKMATSNMLLFRLRFEDNLVLGLLNGYSKDKAMSPSHAAILMAGEPAAALAA
jgi:flagellar transcriptional activator FlhD